MVIKDGRIIKAICKLYNMTYHDYYKYIIDDNNIGYRRILYKNNYYQLQYFSGCFYPYLVKKEEG